MGRHNRHLADDNFTGREIGMYYSEIDNRPVVDKIAESIKSMITPMSKWVMKTFDKTPTGIKVTILFTAVVAAVYYFGIGHSIR